MSFAHEICWETANLLTVLAILGITGIALPAGFWWYDRKHNMGRLERPESDSSKD